MSDVTDLPGGAGAGNPAAVDLPGLSNTPPPSPAPTTDPTPPDAPTSDSSPAPEAPGDKPTSLLDVVNLATQQMKDRMAPPAAPAATPAASPAATPAPTEPGALDADPTEAELAAYPERTRARITALLGQRNAYRDGYDKHTAQLDFMDRSMLSAEEVTRGMLIMAAMKRDDLAAVVELGGDTLRTLIASLTGALPADLAKDVEEGVLDARRAAELANLRRAATNAQAFGQAMVERDGAREAQDRQRAINGAIDGWDQHMRATSADYAVLRPAVMRVAQALIREHGFPPSQDVAQQMLARAYHEARQFASLGRSASPGHVNGAQQPNGKPPPRATPAAPSAAANPTSRARSAPKSLLEAMNGAFDEGRERGLF